MFRPATIAPDNDGGPGAAAAPPDSPVICRRRLGADLRRLRKERRFRLEDAHARIDMRPSTLSRIQTGQAPTRISYLTVLLDLYGVQDRGQRTVMTEMARRGQGKDWWACCADLLAPGTCRYLGLEATASYVRAYSALAVPGLLQTADYAAAAYRASRADLTPDQIARLAAWHAGRQESLRRDGIRVHLVIEEAALTRPLAPEQVIKDQWRHLIGVASSAAVTIQVAGPAAARAVLSPAFTVLSLDGRAQAEIGCCDGPGGQILTTTRHDDVRAAHATFDALSRAALPPARSVELIENLTRG